MPARTPSKDLRTLFHSGTLAGLTDGQLLERFADRRDGGADLAFAALVERHGPMVLRVCRGVLRDEHEAMDAFQVTFLVLARKGGSLWVRDSLGPWLHRVACRAATRARAGAARRRTLELRAAQAVEASGDDDRDDRAAILHEELDRLPDRYRVPIVLCDLEGRSCEEAARHLGRSVRTVKSWRARGRERLKDRLARRGLCGFPSYLIPWMTSPSTMLPSTTIDAVTRIAAARGMTGAVPVAVLSLTEGVLRSMLMAKIKVTVAMLLTLGGLAVGAGVLASQEPGDREPREAQQVKGAEPDAAALLSSDKEKIQGTWRVVSALGHVRGKDWSREMEGGKLVISGHSMTWKVADRTLDTMDFTAFNDAGTHDYRLAPTKEPKWIELKPFGKPIPGIYSLQGDELRICFNGVGTERPSRFAAGPTSPDAVLLRLKRELDPGKDLAARLGRILDDWQRTSAAHSSLDIRFAGQDRSPAWGEGRLTGRVVLLPRGRALVELARHDREGKPDATERSIWTDEALHQIRIERKEHLVWPIPEEYRGRLPAALALPFFWNMSVEGLKSRYRVELLKEEAETWLLSFAPHSEVGRASFLKAILQLDRRTFLPRRYVVVSPDGKSSSDYRVIEARCDRPIPEEIFQLPGGDGWKMIQARKAGTMNWIYRFLGPNLVP